MSWKVAVMFRRKCSDAAFMLYRETCLVSSKANSSGLSCQFRSSNSDSFRYFEIHLTHISFNRSSVKNEFRSSVNLIATEETFFPRLFNLKTSYVSHSIIPLRRWRARATNLISNNSAYWNPTLYANSNATTIYWPKNSGNFSCTFIRALMMTIRYLS